MDHFLQGAFIGAERPGRLKGPLPSHAVTAGMALSNPGGKGAAADGAERRFEPAKTGEAVRTDKPSTLLQEALTARALRRQQKLEERRENVEDPFGFQ